MRHVGLNANLKICLHGNAGINKTCLWFSHESREKVKVVTQIFALVSCFYRLESSCEVKVKKKVNEQKGPPRCEPFHAPMFYKSQLAIDLSFPIYIYIIISFSFNSVYQ